MLKTCETDILTLNGDISQEESEWLIGLICGIQNEMGEDLAGLLRRINLQWEG